MIIDDYMSHVDFNLNNTNGRFTDFTMYTPFYIPYSIYKQLQEKNNITLNPYNTYGFINNNRYFIIMSNNFGGNVNNNIFKLVNTKKDIAGNDYCVSPSLLSSAIVIDKQDLSYTVRNVQNPCLPLNLLNNYYYNYYTDIKSGYGYQGFTLGSNYYDDLMYSGRSTDIIIGMFYFAIPLLIFVFFIKVFRKGVR